MVFAKILIIFQRSRNKK